MGVKQGEIWWANLNPTKGSEQSGHRPVVVVSGNMLNRNLSIVIVMPLTTQIKNYKGNLVLHPNSKNGLNEISEVLIFHIRSLSQSRLSKKIGSIQKNEIQQLISNLNEIMRY